MKNPFRRRKPEQRSIDVPWDVGGPSPIAYNQDRALSLAPVYGAVRIIAQDVSTLPLKAYRKIDGDRLPMPSLPVLFSRLVDSGQLTPWLFQCVTSLALRGNAYGLVVSRDGFQFPTAIEWLSPSEVSWRERTIDAPGQWYWRGREVPSEDMVHIPWFVLPGQKLGLSPMASFANTMGVGLHALEYGDGWFQSGGYPPGTFQNTELAIVDQAQADRMSSMLRASMLARKPLVYGKDWKYEPISVPPEEAQFIQTMKMTANQVASIYGVRPEKIGGEAGSSLTYATVQQNQLEHNTSTLRFWLELLEGAFFALLPERQFVKFNADALVRADLKTRWEVHRIRREIGAANIDEIRALEDESPLPNGAGQDYTPLKASNQEPQEGEQIEPDTGGTSLNRSRKWQISA
jgi:HK97 family phage portal protein